MRRDDRRHRGQTQAARDERHGPARRVRTPRRTNHHAIEPHWGDQARRRQRALRSHGRRDPTPGQTRGTALSPGGPADHRPDGGARDRPERDRRPRRRKLPRPAAERRVPGSHRIGQIASIVRVGEIRVQRTVPRHIRAHARPRRTGDGRGRQTGRRAQARAQILHLQPARHRRMARRQARRTIQAIPARAHGTLVRHGQHRVRPPPPTGDQGMAGSSDRCNT